MSEKKNGQKTGGWVVRSAEGKRAGGRYSRSHSASRLQQAIKSLKSAQKRSK